MKNHGNLYKKDSKGNIRVWFMESNGSTYRTTSGLLDGKCTTSGWTFAEGKNEGKSNETTASEQAVLAVESQYRKKSSVDYHKSIEDTDKELVILPMLANKWKLRKDKIKWGDGAPAMFISPKLDGIRCVTTRHGMFSRYGKPIVVAPHIVEYLAPIFEKYPGLVFDGELYNHDLRKDFNKIVSLVRKSKITEENVAESKLLTQYHIYDMVRDGDRAFGPKELDYRDRYLTLEDIFDGMTREEDAESPIDLVEAQMIESEQECDDWHMAYIKDGYEGSMIRINDFYTMKKRSNSLLKRKDFFDDEFIILDYTEGNGNWAGLPKTISVQLPNGIVGEATMRGTREELLEFGRTFEKFRGGEATVRHFGFTDKGKLRHPTVKAVYDGGRDV